MLSPFLAHILDDDHSVISPELLCARLHIQLADLARLTRVHRNTLSRRPDAPIVQERVGEVARILAAATDLLADSGKATVWFRHQPLAGFDGRTAMELVSDGHASAVIAHLDMLRDGVYA